MFEKTSQNFLKKISIFFEKNLKIVWKKSQNFLKKISKYFKKISKFFEKDLKMRFILPIDGTLTGTTHQVKSGPGSNGSEKIFHIPKSSRTMLGM